MENPALLNPLTRFAGLADGQIWESRDRGEAWSACTIRGEPLATLVALAYE